MPAGVAIGLAVASAATSYIGGQQAASQQEEAAREAAARLNIPFYGPGERITKKAAKFMASKYTGAPLDAMPTARALAGGPFGDVVAPVSGGSGAHFLAPAARASRSNFDIGGKKFNTTMGERYGDLTANALLGQQGAKADFQRWQDEGYMNILHNAPEAPNAAEFLVPLASSLGRIGYNWYQDRHPQGGTIYDEPIGPQKP